MLFNATRRERTGEVRRDDGAQRLVPTQRPDATNAGDLKLDVRSLERELRKAVRGEVRFDDGYRAMYSTDAANYRQIPIAVVLPKDADDAQKAMAICHKHGAPVTPRGGGTSLTGASCNAAVIFDYSKYMNRIIEIDPRRMIAVVEPGVVLDDVRDAVSEHHLTFGPAPATHNRCNIGGMFGNNSCGTPAQFSGRLEDNIFEAEVLLHDGTRMRVGATSPAQLEDIIRAGGRKGEIYAKLKQIRDTYQGLVRDRFPDIPRRVSGYNLNQLADENGFNIARALVGSEGTIVHVLELTLRLVPKPKHEAMALIGFEDIATAGDHVAAANLHMPHTFEAMDETLFQHMHQKGKNPHRQEELFPNGHAWLVCTFGGDTEAEAQHKADALIADLRRRDADVKGARATTDPHIIEEVTRVREAGLGVTSKIPNEPDFYPGWEDSAVAPEHLGTYLREFQQKMQEYGYYASIYGHFGQGCVHCSINFDLFTKEGIEKYRKFAHEMAFICVKYNGSLSGEHGDGQARGELLPIMFGDELVYAFWEFKTAFDPENKMNPGKVVRPFRIDENLRWGVNYQPWDPNTEFELKDDYHSFAYAANRCVGAGVCRKHDSQTMCPSYMVTKEEQYSTRGRARLLFEMLQGNPLKHGWKSEAVKESLDYCLACKGCKHECPVNVDMATYKAEFLHHYFKGKIRPVQMFLFGYMFKWAKLAALMPGVANFFTQAPPFSSILKRIAHVAPQREIPMFADRTFREWFEKRTPRNAGKERVILWTDTWNNHFHPHTAQAAVEVLEDAGYHVLIPPHQICCGRPLYDYGLLNSARKQLHGILADLRPLIREGVPLIGLEPSCLSVFKDEMQNMLGRDMDAHRLATQSFTLEAFLNNKAEKEEHYKPPKLERSAIVHEHCHKKAVLDPTSESHVFGQMQMDFEQLDSGCCGMAGAFGFEQSHYDMSIKCGERRLLPKVRDAKPQTIVVADGFSCREQIAQTTKRQALHPAQVMKLALDDRGYSRSDAYPELRFMPDPQKKRRLIVLRGYAVLGALTLAGAAAAALLLGKRGA
ncbi:MAG TPA: FAD-linked oxidase C-terminal domain-containing protein [Candidatus Baltobacteraceae bacterium]|nr:FAD-linked oxidase C-terminal domain-containing protein [Candidatus Baltobacteraceae bacterium]